MCNLKKTCVIVLVFCACGIGAQSSGQNSGATGQAHEKIEQTQERQNKDMMGKIDSTFKSVDERFKQAVKNCHARMVNKYHEIEEAYKKVGQKIARLTQKTQENVSSDSKVTVTGKK